MKSKYIIFFVIFIFFMIIIYIFYKSGNNIISKDKSQIIEKILNINQYEANLKVTVYSNKNVNEYNLIQFENIEEKDSYEIIKNKSNEDIVKIELKNNKLVISNIKDKLIKVYENYNDITKNYLFLSNFLSEVNEKEANEEDKYIILNTKSTENFYLHKKYLYINKTNGLPEKLVIIDKKQNTKTIIEYIDIKIN